jgi:hypothetical protein
MNWYRNFPVDRSIVEEAEGQISVRAEATTLSKNAFLEQNKMAANKNDEFPPLGSDKCGICTKKVLAKDKALQCEICFVWYHCDCDLPTHQC